MIDVWEGGALLDATGRLSFDGGAYVVHVAFERRFRIFTVHREGLVWDTRWLPPSLRLSSDRYYVLLEGKLEIFGAGRRVFHAPQAFQVQGCDEPPPHGRVDIRASGPVFRILELRDKHPRQDTQREAWTPLEVPRALLDDCDAYEVAARRGHVPAEVRDALLDRFVSVAWLTPEARGSIVPEEPLRMLRTWSAMTEMFRDLRVSPALVELADHAEVSLRQAERDFTEVFETFASDSAGWRTITRRFRLALAVLMLSAESSTVTNVAKQVGYSAPEAMTTAFRAAGLPSPRELQRRLRSDE
jgi:AraC-like DNA-binding protein